MRELGFREAATIPRGAWDPAFSPDGTLLRYVQDVDGASLEHRSVETCVWDLNAGRVVALFRGHSATWAQDMRRMVFVRDGCVFLAGADGCNPVEVGPGDGPVWRRDDNELFYTSRDGSGARLMRVSGSDAPEAVAEVGVGTPWALSPGGQWLAYVWVEPSTERIAGLPDFVEQRGSFTGRPQVRVLHLPTGKAYVGDVFPEGSFVERVAWSPDGNTLAFCWELVWSPQGSIRRETRIWRPVGGETQVVNVGDGACSVRPFWSPDGAKLAVTANPWGRYTPIATGWLTLVDVATNTVCGQNRAEHATSPIFWRPDSSDLCCRACRHIEEPYALFSADGTLMRDIMPSHTYGSAAALSPDGALFAASTRAFSELNEIWLCHLDGGEPVRITSASRPLGEFALGRVWSLRWDTPDELSLDGIVVDPPGEAGADTPVMVFPWVDQRGWFICDLEPGLNLGFLTHAIAQRGYRIFIPCHRMAGMAGLQHTKDNLITIESAQDIGHGVDALRAALDTDAPVVAFGHSVGAALTCNLLIERPDLVIAAALSGAYPDNVSMYAYSIVGSPLARERFGGVPWEKPVEFIAASPMRDVNAVQAGVLLLMGDLDWCAGAQLYYAALLHAGKDVTYLLFKNQDHWPDDPNRVVALTEIAVRWLDERLQERNR